MCNDMYKYQTRLTLVSLASVVDHQVWLKTDLQDLS
jgi:hypothetical protein